MSATLREYDGARHVHMDRVGASVFIWRDGGACFEFDSSLFLHGVMKFLETQFAAELPSLSGGGVRRD